MASYKVADGQTSIGIVLDSNEFMDVYSGGLAIGTVISDGGALHLSGGVAINTILNAYGNIYASGLNLCHIGSNTCSIGEINSEGILSNVSGLVLSGGDYYLHVTGTAKDISIAGSTRCSATMYLENGGVASNAAVRYNGTFNIHSGATANQTTLAGGSMYVAAGGSALNISANNGIMTIVGGYVSNTVLTSTHITLSSGAVAADTVISGGRMYIEGTHKGTFHIENDAWIETSSKCIIDFTVADRTTADSWLINDLAKITGTPTYTITVSADQESGTYKLAQGAGSFNKTVTIGDGTVDYGSITVNGDDLVYNGMSYSLDKVNGELTLTIKADVADNDLDGNGLADVILVHTKQGYSGAWLTTGTSSVIKWGSLSNLKAGTEILGTGTLYGSENDGQDIFFADSKSVGAWNVVDGKVTGYKSIMSVNSTTNVLGLGDFNGDGATDILLRSTNGDLGYYNTDGTGFTYLKGLGKEWTVAAIGDLNGDGLDDVVLRHDAGFAGTFLTQENGTVKWASLDTLKSDMSIVGTGDFNGDGVDDVLLQNKSNGWVGAWLVEEGRVDSFIGLCKNKNSIEQIADFNGDGIDDLRVRAGADIGVLYVNGADDTTWQYFKSVGKEWDTSFALIS